MGASSATSLGAIGTSMPCRFAARSSAPTSGWRPASSAGSLSPKARDRQAVHFAEPRQAGRDPILLRRRDRGRMVERADAEVEGLLTIRLERDRRPARCRLEDANTRRVACVAHVGSRQIEGESLRVVEMPVACRWKVLDSFDVRRPREFLRIHWSGDDSPQFLLTSCRFD